MTDPIGGPIGARFREARLARKLSLRELAERAGMSRPNIRRLERGLTEPRLSTVARVAKALDLSVTFFVSVLDGCGRG